MSLYFSYGPNGEGINFHPDASSARSRAKEAFYLERDSAAEGWDENVTEICWGEVHERVAEKSRTKVPEDHSLEGLFDGLINYGFIVPGGLDKKLYMVSMIIESITRALTVSRSP